jgi:outer membrane protein assembly factor BamB
MKKTMGLALRGRTTISLACLILTACGGGSGGGGAGSNNNSGGTTTPPPVATTPEVKLLSGTVTRFAAQDSSVAFEVQVKPNFTPTGTLFVNASDKAGVIGQQVTVTAGTDGSYVLALETVGGTKPGHYTGDITLKLCADQACATPQAVPSMTVPYDVTVQGSGTAWPGDRLTALTPWTDVPDWTTFQGNAAHTGYVPVEIKPEQLLPRWKMGALTQTNNYYSTYTATLVAADGIFYAAGNNQLKARKEYDGSLVWSYDVSSMQYPSVNPPAVANGVVYMAAGQQQSTTMFAFDAATGAVRFRSPMGSQWDNYLSPVAVDDAVYTNGGSYGGLYGFSPTGDRLFFTSVTQTSMWSPAVDANSVYVFDGSLQIIDRKTGTVLSTARDGSSAYTSYQIGGAPVLGAPGSLFVARYGNAGIYGGNELLRFNIAKSYVDWRIPGSYPLTPAYASGLVYAPNTSPYRIEVRAEADGALQWFWTPPQAAETGWMAEPLVTKNLLFVSTNVATYAIDLRTHKTVWSYPAGGKLALTRSGVLYIQNADAVVAFNVK